MDAPAVVRRRRKIARQQREQTPEASKLAKIKYSDEESSSATDHRLPSHIPVLKISSNPPEVPERRVEPNAATRQASGHLSKILQRRDRKTAPTVGRSTSIPRDELVDTKPSEIFNLMRKARRSLSQPRHKDESSDSGARSPSPVVTRKKPTSPTSQTARATKEEQLSQFEINIMRFEEERRRFTQEKKRFEHEKRELDLMRVKRAAEFDKNAALPSNLQRLTDRKPSDASEERVKLIKEFNGAQKLVMSKSSDCVPKRNERPSDYESSTESCSSDEVTDESDIEELVKSLPDTTKKMMKEVIVKEWVAESLSMTLDDDGKPKIIANGAEDIDDPISNEVIDNIDNIEKIDIPAKLATESEMVPKEAPLLVANGDKNDKVNGKASKDKVKDGKKTKKEAKNSKPLVRSMFSDSRRIWRELKAEHSKEIERFIHDKNKCIADFIILVIYCGIGGMIFRFTEGSFENMYKCGVKRVKRDFVDQLWISSHSMREDDWKSLARTRLRKFEEELQVALEAGVTSYSGQKAWTFMNGVVYCMTVVTTIGYGHISPSTNTGRAITIVYAIFGIPLFLILLADFGKLFTRGIKFLWGFVRRVYYTRSCRKVRKTAQVQEVMRGFNMVYDIATFRRPSMIAREEAAAAASANDEDEENPPDPDKPELPPKRAPIASPIASPITSSTATPLSQASTLAPPSGHESPTTPAPEVFEIDDEFNLPISLALFILLAYIIIGATIYSIWESWSFFESFYFVFISMSTIGFGDYVPQHPIYMMASILYLVFGLALTSMCINVVQLKLSDHFRQASSKIGATIGLKMAEEEAAALNSLTHTPAELASVHSQSPKAVEPGHLRFEFSPPQQMYIHPYISSPIHTPPPHVEFAPNFNFNTNNSNYVSSGESDKKKKKEKIKKSKK